MFKTPARVNVKQSVKSLRIPVVVTYTNQSNSRFGCSVCSLAGAAPPRRLLAFKDFSVTECESKEQRLKRLARERSRRYRESHREFLRAQGKVYAATHKGQTRLRNIRYRDQHRARVNDAAQAFRTANPERARATYRRSYYKHHERNLAAMKSFRTTHIEQIRQWRREASRRLKEKVFAHYGWRCVCCGETLREFMTIDHINGDGKKHREEIGSGRLYGWLVKNSFPQGFRTLCMNCNWARGKFGYCPHERLAENVAS